jgi:hypothetical protein
MQNSHPLHLSAMIIMSTFLSLSPCGGAIGRLVSPFALHGLPFLVRVTVLDTFSRPILEMACFRGIFRSGLDIEIVQEIHTIHIFRDMPTDSAVKSDAFL